MIAHTSLGNTPFSRNRKLAMLINNGPVKFGGNKKLRIYGKLSCASGKRMKVENRVFFSSAEEAEQNAYRPCGHCMRTENLRWKNG